MGINKCIDLLKQGQPFYATHTPELSYDAGVDMAQTWADMILVDFEHHHFDIGGLGQFMKGLTAGGPTASGHLTPTVVTTLPHSAITVEEVRYNAWQMRHALSTGVHGLLHTHARDPEAVKWFVAACRYPFQTLARDVIPEGLRGGGGQGRPAELWGMSAREYVERATRGRSTLTANSSSASKSKTATAWQTPTKPPPYQASPSPSGDQATWECHTATPTPMTRHTPTTWTTPETSSRTPSTELVSASTPDGVTTT